MRVALVNPPWSFEGSIYFGCREPHLPLEYGYARALLERAGHEVRLFDAQLDGISLGELCARVRAFAPDATVLTTAPSYLFWRCAPPELTIPIRVARALRAHAGTLIVIGPHASTTPASTLRKVGADVAVLGECEEILPRLIGADREAYASIPSIAYFDLSSPLREAGLPPVIVRSGTHASDMTTLPELSWEPELVQRHRHHHHRFDREPAGPGAELEASRGCPYRCTFCAKENFRDKYRKRPLARVLAELDGLASAGARYVYFIDEIFLPDRALLEALVERDLDFGVQLRIDNWSREMLELLGRAGCVSIEAGVESVTPDGRSLLQKRCKLSTNELVSLLVEAKRHVPFVQANLIGAGDPPAEIAAFRQRLQEHGVWSNDPVPLFQYPGSPGYRLLWGNADDTAWERAHEHYLRECAGFSDIQEQRPLPLAQLESRA
jgi:B12-binding domain/radical SAM domain protein of rhizo-twelve system